jgi:hypothetical protein
MENLKLYHTDQRMLVVGVGVNAVSMQGIVDMVIMHKKFQFNVKDLYTTKFSVLS